MFRDLVVAWRRGPRFWGDASKSVWELIVAYRTLRFTPAARLPLRQATQPSLPEAFLSVKQAMLIERVAYAIPVMAMRVPWRSDCLVQALAAQRWLTGAAIASQISLCVRKDGQKFRAHAWLKAGDRIVTGGDISSYAKLLPAQTGRERFKK